jgi:hypothetical protein
MWDEQIVNLILPGIYQTSVIEAEYLKLIAFLENEQFSTDNTPKGISVNSEKVIIRVVDNDPTPFEDLNNPLLISLIGYSITLGISKYLVYDASDEYDREVRYYIRNAKYYWIEKDYPSIDNKKLQSLSQIRITLN